MTLLTSTAISNLMPALASLWSCSWKCTLKCGVPTRVSPSCVQHTRSVCRSSSWSHLWLNHAIYMDFVFALITLSEAPECRERLASWSVLVLRWNGFYVICIEFVVLSFHFRLSGCGFLVKHVDSPWCASYNIFRCYEFRVQRGVYVRQCPRAV